VGGRLQSIGAEAQELWNTTIKCATTFPPSPEGQTMALVKARDEFTTKARRIIAADFREHTLQLETASQVAPVVGPA
jgi:hypothetical protein